MGTNLLADRNRLHVHAVQVGGGLSIAARALHAIDLVEESLDVQLIIGSDSCQVLGQVHAGAINDASVRNAGGWISAGA